MHRVRHFRSLGLQMTFIHDSEKRLEMLSKYRFLFNVLIWGNWHIDPFRPRDDTCRHHSWSAVERSPRVIGSAATALPTTAAVAAAAKVKYFLTFLQNRWSYFLKNSHYHFFMMMTSTITSQGGFNVVSLYSPIHEIRTFYDNSKANKDIIITLPVHMYYGTIFVWIRIHDITDDVTRSQSRSIFLSCWYIQLAVSPPKKVCHNLKMAAILKYQTQIQFYIGYETIVPNYTGSKLQGQCVVNKCGYRNRLSFRDRRSTVNVTCLLCVLGT